MKNNNSIELIPTKYSSIFKILLDLQFEKRCIGKLDLAGDGTFLTQRKENHLFKKLHSLGLNHQLLIDERLLFKWIVIDYCGHKLVTSRLYFLTHGDVFTFEKSGFEKQVFLPLCEFGINKAREWESERLRQGNLFDVA